MKWFITVLAGVSIVAMLFMGCGEEASQQDVQNAVDNMVDALVNKATSCGYEVSESFSITCSSATKADVTDLNNCAQALRNMTCEQTTALMENGESVPGCEAAEELCTFNLV